MPTQTDVFDYKQMYEENNQKTGSFANLLLVPILTDY
jgi:hypothetical protein